MKRFVLSLLAAVLTIPVVRAEVRPRGPFEDGRLPLVPYPAEVCLGERDFDLGKRLTVRICSGDEEDFFAASTLTDELIGVRTDVKESRSGIERSVTLTRPGLCRAADEMSDLYDAVVRDDDRGYAVNTALYDLVMPYASRLGSLRDMTKELKLFHRDLWHAENRPIHWDVVAVRYDRMLLEWETQYDRIQLDLQQQARTGMHLPREQVGFRFDRPKP